ncbi:MAG: putative DNA-binding domain-containing protein [Burkholderiales bacterium]|nr:putative DNA-binding domain-containing protein [Burkholderiales bacterium]
MSAVRRDLARQQQVLLDALLAWPADDAIKKVAAYAVDPRARGLKAYQANGHMLAERALQAVYPVLAQLLGGESFADLARALWHAHPPTRGDVACWGGDLAAFVQTSAQLQDEPYLADVARAEWALHQCAGAPDASADLSTLALLTSEDPDQLTLALAPGCTALRCAWPVAAILGAHRDGKPSLQEAGALLRAGVAQDVLVWRAGLRPAVREAVAGEVDVVQALLDGASLGGALERAPALDFGQWLPMAVQTGLALAVVRA